MAKNIYLLRTLKRNGGSGALTKEQRRNRVVAFKSDVREQVQIMRDRSSTDSWRS
jgi:hypothetical protein